MAAGEDGTVAFLFHTGYLSADVGAGKLLANRREVGDCEKFRVTRHADGTISLLTLSTGKYLSAQSGGGGGVVADAAAIGQWERFTPIVADDKLYLGAANGQYLSSQPRR